MTEDIIDEASREWLALIVARKLRSEDVLATSGINAMGPALFALEYWLALFSECGNSLDVIHAASGHRLHYLFGVEHLVEG